MVQVKVYFSSMASTLKAKKDGQSAEFMFTKKQVPFEMVDLVSMDKAERDKVFEKAGTRQIPLIFFDDEYVGTYEDVQQIDDAEELDKRLGIQKSE